MDELAAARTLKKMTGLWGKLLDERLEAYDSWLRRGCRATEEQVVAALEALAETLPHMPKIAEIVAKLREQGAVSEQSSAGSLKHGIRKQMAEYVATRERLDASSAPTFLGACEGHRAVCVENARLDPGGPWNDRIAAIDSILAEEGVMPSR